MQSFMAVTSLARLSHCMLGFDGNWQMDGCPLAVAPQWRTLLFLASFHMKAAFTFDILQHHHRLQLKRDEGIEKDRPLGLDVEYS